MRVVKTPKPDPIGSWLGSIGEKLEMSTVTALRGSIVARGLNLEAERYMIVAVDQLDLPPRSLSRSASARLSPLRAVA